MTRILAVETSSRLLSVALWDGALVRKAEELGERIHAARLVPLVRDLLAEAGWSLRSVDLFAAGVGPGSFTGLRIGLAAVNAWAYALDRPALGVSSAEAIAWQALTSTSPAETTPPRRIEITIRSRPGELYTASYRCAESGALMAIRDPAYESDNAWLAGLGGQATEIMAPAGRAGNEPSDRELERRGMTAKTVPGGRAEADVSGSRLACAPGDATTPLPGWVVGDGLADADLAAALSEAGWRLADPTTWLPRAATVAELAAARIGARRLDSRLAEDAAKTARPGSSAPLLPVYVRDPVAPDAPPERVP